MREPRAVDTVKFLVCSEASVRATRQDRPKIVEFRLNLWSRAAAPSSYADDLPSTLMGVTVLGYDDQLVEIEAVAAVVD